MKNWLIIGSTAAYHWFPQSWDSPKDIDILTPAQISGNVSQVCVVDAQWHDLAQEIIDINVDPVFADPSTLMTLKLSHSYWPHHWKKAVRDVAKFKKLGVEINRPLYDKLVPMWGKIHGEKRVNTNVPVEEFFNDAVTREHDHEYLHELVAFNGVPMHVKLRPDLNTAFVSKERWNALSYEQQCETALEEMIVVAIERHRLTASNRQSEKLLALSDAHYKLCTTMTKGWFAEFLVYNSTELLSQRRNKMLDKLNNVLTKL